MLNVSDDEPRLQAYLSKPGNLSSTKKHDGWFKNNESVALPSVWKNLHPPPSESAETEELLLDTSNTQNRLENTDLYHSTNSYSLIILMFKKLGLTSSEIENILTEDIKKSKPFELCMKSLQQNYENYRKLYDTYTQQGVKFRAQSKLKSTTQLI